MNKMYNLIVWDKTGTVSDSYSCESLAEMTGILTGLGVVAGHKKQVWSNEINEYVDLC